MVNNNIIIICNARICDTVYYIIYYYYKRYTRLVRNSSVAGLAFIVLTICRFQKTSKTVNERKKLRNLISPPIHIGTCYIKHITLLRRFYDNKCVHSR